MNIGENIIRLHEELPDGVTLVAVSKTCPPQAVMEAYGAGQRIFGENRPQEMKAKYEQLPKDIRWHMIGHLQTNKVKYIAPFVELIQSVDSERLLEAIDTQAKKNNRVIDVLLEVFIASEETKQGWDRNELSEFISSGGHRKFGNVAIRGLMGMASLTDDESAVRNEFRNLAELFQKLKDEHFSVPDIPPFDILSMGMTSDCRIAIECGSNMVRIGSRIFGSRT